MSPNLEALLREALTPVEPPAHLASRLEGTLVNIAEFAHDELESWELSAMGDLRNWVRPAAAVIATATAGSTLVALRVHRRRRARKQEAGNLLDLAERTLQDIAEETRRILPDR